MPGTTNSQVLAAVKDMHDCLDRVATKVEKLGERVAYIEGRQDAVAQRVGVPAEGEKPSPRPFLLDRGKAIVAGLGALGAGAAGYKIAAAGLVAVHQAMLAATP
jgi:hypothetical protein